MSDKKYPLFSSELMQVNSFAFVDSAYQHPFKDEWIVGAVGHALNEQSMNDADVTHQNDFLVAFDMFMKDSELDDYE